MLHDNNLIEMSLRLNRSEPLFRTILELPRIGRRPRTRDDLRLLRNLPLSFKVVRQKPDQTFIFRTLQARNLDFHSPQIVSFKSAVKFKKGYLKNIFKETKRNNTKKIFKA